MIYEWIRLQKIFQNNFIQAPSVWQFFFTIYRWIEILFKDLQALVTCILLINNSVAGLPVLKSYVYIVYRSDICE